MAPRKSKTAAGAVHDHASRESDRPVTTADRRVAKARKLTIGQVQLLQTRRGLSPEALRKVPEKVLQRAIRRLDYPDLPRAREAFRLLQERGEAGVIPPNALVHAIKPLDSTRARRTPAL